MHMVKTDIPFLCLEGVEARAQRALAMHKIVPCGPILSIASFLSSGVVISIHSVINSLFEASMNKCNGLENNH